MPAASLRRQRHKRKESRANAVIPPLASEIEQTVCKPAFARPKPIVVPPVFVGRIRECCWPMGNVGRKWTFCDAPTIPGKDYCEPHHTLGFYKPRVRGEIGGGRSNVHSDA
jgi:hypothetical protein